MKALSIGNRVESPPSLSHYIRAAPGGIRGKLDHDFLLTGEVFSSDLIEYWMETKIEKEYNEVRNRPHLYEISLYSDV